jgi:hypothetical protein
MRDARTLRSGERLNFELHLVRRRLGARREKKSAARKRAGIPAKGTGPKWRSSMQSDSVSHGTSEHKRLRRLRHHAKRHGFRITRVFGDFSLITTLTAPPRAVCGLRGVDLTTIEAALLLPPQEASTSRRKPPGESAIREFINVAGAEAVLAVIDQMTRPPLAAAAE